MAVQAVANIVKTSLGPVGLDKMLVDDIGDVTITNDGATILKLLEVEHPAAKVRSPPDLLPGGTARAFFHARRQLSDRSRVFKSRPAAASPRLIVTHRHSPAPFHPQILVELADLQDREVGDGTTSVVILAGELLRRANDLVRNKIHPTSIISGYRLAMREAVKYVESKLATDIETLGEDAILKTAKTSMSSKIVGADSDFFGKMVVDAVKAVKTYNDYGDARYPIRSINILKAHGKSVKESRVINGYALNLGRAAQGMVKSVKNAKVACVDFNLQKTKMQMGVQVLVTDPKELERIRQEELEITARRVKMILDAGANVILCSKGIDDMALKYFVEAGAIACRRVPKDDLRRVAKATGATILLTLADMEGGETFDPSALGTCAEVCEERVSDDDMIVLKDCANTQACTMLIRGANDYMLDEVDRSLHDALCIVKRTLESQNVVAGGGAVEAALSVYLETLATTLGSREQLAIAEFAESLLVIPKVLAVNAAKDSTELVAKLRAYHHAAQTKPEKAHLAGYGLDLVKGELKDNIADGVLEPAMSKVKSIQFATEAAITILRIDDLIKLHPEEEQQ
jgi:T-complex protein 1 subunit alpha